MERVFTASEVQDKLDCYGECNRDDTICVGHCALNVACAILKARVLDSLTVPFEAGVRMPSCRSDIR